MTPGFWNLVLAGGAGRRLEGVTGGVPKQFWSVDGRRTMVEHTVGRVLGMIPPSRVVTVIGPGQEQHARRLVEARGLGRIVPQRVDRGTGIATLAGLAEILRHEDDPVVLLTPADHGIACVAEYRAGVRRAVAAVSAGRHDVVLFGVVPTEAAPDYGWILPRASRVRRAFHPVDAFVEKPPLHEAAALLGAGGLWNTLVVVARARALLALFEARLPGLADTIIGRTSPPEGWPVVDLSGDILTNAAGLAVYVWPDSLGWSDLGTPARLAQWLRNTVTPLAIGRPLPPVARRLTA